MFVKLLFGDGKVDGHVEGSDLLKCFVGRSDDHGGRSKIWQVSVFSRELRVLLFNTFYCGLLLRDGLKKIISVGKNCFLQNGHFNSVEIVESASLMIPVRHSRQILWPHRIASSHLCPLSNLSKFIGHSRMLSEMVTHSG